MRSVESTQFNTSLWKKFLNDVHGMRKIVYFSARKVLQRNKSSSDSSLIPLKQTSSIDSYEHRHAIVRTLNCELKEIFTLSRLRRVSFARKMACSVIFPHLSISRHRRRFAAVVSRMKFAVSIVVLLRFTLRRWTKVDSSSFWYNFPVFAMSSWRHLERIFLLDESPSNTNLHHEWHTLGTAARSLGSRKANTNCQRKHSTKVIVSPFAVYRWTQQIAHSITKLICCVMLFSVTFLLEDGHEYFRHEYFDCHSTCFCLEAIIGTS